jgi:hypothetical protein
VKTGPWAAASLLAAAVLLSHLPLLRAGYAQDDHVAVEGNAIVAAGDASAIVRAGYWEGVRGADRTLYRPVTVASFALERLIAGDGRPDVSHAVNLALHAVVCWLIFAIAVRCGVEPVAALLAAVLFAVTPSKSEAVANIVGRSEILAALFTLAATRLALEKGIRGAAWSAAACVLLAGASKETGMAALPIVIVAASGERRLWDVLGTIAPSVLAFFVLIVLRTLALEAFFPAQVVAAIDNPLVREHGVRYGATALGLVAHYARIVVFPFGLANDYSGGSIPIEASFFALRPILGAALVLALVVAATRSRITVLFAAIVVVPYLAIGNVFVPAGAIFAERFLYLPVAGLCLLASLAIAATGRTGRLVAATAIVVFGLAMFVRSADWKDDPTIFAATVRHNPKSPKALYWLGRYDDALAAWPEIAGPWQDKGVQLAKDGDLAGAERALRESARLEPTRAAAHLNLGIVLHRQGRLEAAEREVRKAALLEPDNARAFAELGHIRYESGNLAEAATAYRRAVALGRTDLIPRATLGPK